MKTKFKFLPQAIIITCLLIFKMSIYAQDNVTSGPSLPLTGLSGAEYQKYIAKINEFNAATIDPKIKEVIKDILNKVEGSELLSGAHIVKRDNGALYLRLKEDLAGANIRSSSHYPKVQFNTPELQEKFSNQYGFDIPVLGHVLFGARPSQNNPNEIQSWLQFESHGVDIAHIAQHMLSFLQHKLYGYQVGPMGTCPYTEKWINPTVRTRNPEQYGSEIIVE